MNDHRLIDARSREMHRIVADRIGRDPGILERARQTIARWRPNQSPRSMPYLDRWQRLIDAGPDAVIAKLLEDSDDGDVMRQTSPFAGVLTNEERWAITGEYSRLDAEQTEGQP
jgi:hypothetical protein